MSKHTSRLYKKILESSVGSKLLSMFSALILLSSAGISSYDVWAEDDIVDTIPVPSRDVAANPVTNKVYATSSDGLVVMDGSTNDIVSTIQVEPNPFSVEVNSITNRVYVTHWDSMAVTNGGNVTVIDGETDSIVGKIQTGYAYDVAINADTNMIYVSTSGAVTVIDGTTDSIVTTISVGGSPGGLDVNPVTNTIYVVCNCSDGHLAVIDGATNTVSTLIMIVRTLPSHYVAVNSDTNKIYVTYRYGVAVVDGQTNTVIGYTGSCPNASYGVDVNPTTNKVYVGCRSSDPLVSVIDGSTDTAKYNIALSGAPEGISVNTDTNRVYVATSNSFTVLDGNLSSTTSQLTVNSQDSNANAISGYYTELFQNDVLIDAGFTPISFTLNNGETYKVHVDDYDKYVFDHWSDTGDTSADRIISITSDHTITAVYKTVPQPPTDLRASATTSSQIDLVWNAPSDDGGAQITGYVIERSDDGSTWSTIVDDNGNTTYSDTRLSPNTTYTYRVSATNSVGSSDPSNTASATTPMLSAGGIVVGPIPIPISILPLP